MWKRNSLLFIFVFSFLGCATTTDNRGQENNFPHTDLSHINLPQGEQRFVEENGGFSLMIPWDWYITDFPGQRYRVIRGPVENGIMPFIGFSIESFDGALAVMIDLLLEEWITIHQENFELIYRGNFITLNGLEGEKLVVTILMYGQHHRQIIYCLPGRGDTTILLLCNIPVKVGNAFDETFERIARTFEWLPLPSTLREGNRHVEEAGGFSIIIPDVWEVVEMPTSEYKVLIRRESDSIVVVFFTIVPTELPLSDLIDMTLDEWDRRYGANFLKLSRSGFVTLENLYGEKLVSHIIQGEQQLRQISHFLPGENNKVMLVTSGVTIEAGSAFDEKLDRIMETFEWVSE